MKIRSKIQEIFQVKFDFFKYGFPVLTGVKSIYINLI